MAGDLAYTLISSLFEAVTLVFLFRICIKPLCYAIFVCFHTRCIFVKHKLSSPDSLATIYRPIN